ncbi:hypothetical protein ScPMuIL_018982 [Solemya velum]
MYHCKQTGQFLHKDHLLKLTTSNYCNEAILNASGTIFAVCSGFGKCGVSVVRISGTQASLVLKKIGQMRKLPKPRTAVYRRLVNPDLKEPIDRGLVMWFPGPASFTGEDTVEFHVHGGPAVITALLTALGTIPDLRHAQPGEFTKRSFMNGKLDLTEVEGLADLIHAETESQRIQALRQLEGDLHHLYGDWRTRLLKCTANVNAYIDFSEDDNIEEDILDIVNREVQSLMNEIKAHLSDNRRGERLRDGVQVAILGKPNVGKSSLLNAITQRPAAIVSPVPGTTRDVVDISLNLGGYPVLLSDTAGLRETPDAVEQEGVRRAVSRAGKSDVQVIVLEAQIFASQQRSLKEIIHIHFQELGISLTQNNEETTEGADCSDKVVQGSDVVVVLNKCDLIELDTLQKPIEDIDGIRVCILSCLTGEGMEKFLNILTEKVKDMCGSPSAGSPSLTQVRHRTHLTQCLHHMVLYGERTRGGDIVLAAQSLRRALGELGRIMGHVTSEDILDVIFRDFCIGK